MAASVSGRELILDILLQITRDGEYSHIALKNALDQYQYLDKKERAFITRVVEGTLERMIELDYIIDQYSRVKTGKMKPVIRTILRSAVYQLKYMDSVPDSAACNEAVKLAAKRGFGNLRGFVNGVLRTVSRNLGEIPYPPKDEPLRYLSVRYSLPEWILEQWLAEYDEDTVCRMAEEFLKEKPVTVRFDPDKISGEELMRILREEEVCAREDENLPYALHLEGLDYLMKLPSFRKGYYQVQDVSSMRVAEWAEVRAGDHIIDVCAAPGGKAIHLAEMLRGSGRVEARDLTDYKVELIRENIRRSGLSNIEAVRMDARRLDEASVGKADIVIADLPCSGLGVLGRKPDLRYKMTLEKQKELIRLQREILSVVKAYVRPGGRLLYSTCTINRGENEENAEWFIRQCPEFQLRRQQQMLPGTEGGDGFYIAMFERMGKKDIASFDYEELKTEIVSMGEKPFRSRQIYEWIHVKLADSFEEMTNLSKQLREKLEERYTISAVKLVERQISKADPTEKYLFELADGNMIESVLMRYTYGNSVCISSQAGCRMGCRFCASAIGGFKRNLTASEMLRQIYEIQKMIGERISNIVVMGTGEPLDNYDNFVKFVRMVSDEYGLNISQRNITASTCGIVPNMLRLAEEGLQITLALSLHGSNQEKRERLMPVARQYELEDVLEACDEYFRKTGRRITFEYSLVEGVNDQPEDIRELVHILKKRNCHLNLIPVNPIKEREYRKPGRESALDFKNKLEKNGINVTIRRERGSDIDGACGQLRRRYAEGSEV